MTLRLDPRHCLVAALCVGLAAANLQRLASLLVVLAAVAAAAAELGVGPRGRGAGVLLGLALLGWWWGSVRLDSIDRSPLLSRVGTAERALLEVTAPPRPGPYDVRVPVRVRRFGWLRPYEAALLRLPRGRAPPQGSLLEAVVVVKRPRGPQNGFDERDLSSSPRRPRRAAGRSVPRRRPARRPGRSRRQPAGAARPLRRRAADRRAPRAWSRGSCSATTRASPPPSATTFAPRASTTSWRCRARTSCSSPSGSWRCCWLAGIPRLFGELAALAAIGAYVLAVGPQPSVIRAGVSGALGSLAWIAARERDRWHFLLLGALVLLAWNPYTLMDAGLPALVRGRRGDLRARAAARSDGSRAIRSRKACAGRSRSRRHVVSRPRRCCWLQFHAIPLLSVPANAAAAPAMGPLLYLAFASAAVAPISGQAATALAWVNGWCAAYLAGCARVVAGLPFAQVRSSGGLLCLVAVAGAAAAYALRHERAEARLPARGHRPAEDHAGAAAASEPGGGGRGRAPRRGGDEW